MLPGAKRLSTTHFAGFNFVRIEGLKFFPGILYTRIQRIFDFGRQGCCIKGFTGYQANFCKLLPEVFFGWMRRAELQVEVTG